MDPRSPDERQGEHPEATLARPRALLVRSRTTPGSVERRPSDRDGEADRSTGHAADVLS